VSSCVICHRPQTIDRMACTACEITMARQLVDVVEFYCLAEGELVPGSGGERGTERGLGVRLSALDFLAGHDAVAVLASWESDWRETYDLSIEPMLSRPGPLLARSVAFLRAWLPRSCDTHPAIDDFARELAECWSAARSAARCSPPRNQSITCPADHPDDESRMCGYRIPIDADHAHGIVTCKRCRTDWNVLHLMHVAISTPGAEFWADPEAAAGYFRVTSKTLRQWARSKGIRRERGRYEMHSIHLAIHGASETA
jgi:hypothetical protein